MKRWSIPICSLIIGVLSGGYLVGSLLHGQAPQPPAVPRELTSYRDVVKKVLPAVVSLEVKMASKIGRGPLDETKDSPRLGFGSGFIIDPKGVVVTNYHVVEGAEQVTVTLMDGRKFVSKDIRSDRRTDLAIIRLEVTKPLPALEFADSDAMEIGDRVLAFGAPFGLTGSVTSGIVSAKGRSGLSMNMYEDFLQTDAAINPGNSGGPLVNLEGKVIGINSAIKSRTGGFQGVGLAIASNLAKSVMKALQTDGVVRRGYLGTQIRELPLEMAQRLGLAKEGGVLVGEVYEKTPAAKAGLQTGDVITTIAGKTIKDGRMLQTIVAGLPLNKAADVVIVRDGKRQTIAVTIEEQPVEFGTRAPVPQPVPAQPDGVAIDKLGLEIADLSEQLAQELGYRKGATGAVITGVAPGSPAAQAGLRRGMLVTKIDRQAVASAAAARDLFGKASLDKGILLQVQSPHSGTNFVLLQASE